MFDLDIIFDGAQKIGTFLAQFILALYFCKQYIDKQNVKMPIGTKVKDQNKEDLTIMKTMEYYKEVLKADRILIFEFHNGNHYSNYRSALKVSASYEVYRASLESTRERCKDLPIAFMPHLISAITEKGYFYCKDIENIKEIMPTSYGFKKSLGLEAFCDLVIKDEKNNIVGFVAVQWNHPIDWVDEENLKKLTWKLEESIQTLTRLDRKKDKKLFFRK